MPYKQGRYYKLIKPLFLVVDLFIINATIFLFDTNITNTYIFLCYISLMWFVVSIKNGFYEVQRNTRIVQIITLLLRQIVFFALILYAFIGFFKQPNISRLALGSYVISVFVFITFFKFFLTH